ncbi:MAG: hypothetical protein M3X11_06980 [Acidobacteriota bacterium]|nr:hypothetical protein [Acidobacteriota bacterium]
MSTAAKESIALGSHQFLDAFALAYHRSVAELLCVTPEPILQHARKNLTAWIARGQMSAGAMLSLREWQKLLDESTVPQLISSIIDESDEGQRLRQSSPFAGTLTAEERLEILAECEKGASSQTG